ncbi:hypothetical protein MPC4_70018 [Methylocella tundrae]|uniref:Uncharacterized protein n=1 Tax=Methylocella tundrae TaxID=227605 RepID=A0A8B6MBN4_METTU|nr:hypothetical protein MPC4_70018 [Methylocella tundrae]
MVLAAQAVRRTHESHENQTLGTPSDLAEARRFAQKRQVAARSGSKWQRARRKRFSNITQRRSSPGISRASSPTIARTP